MPIKLTVALAVFAAFGLGVCGCSGGASDPVAASTNRSDLTIAPQATMGPEDAQKVQDDIMKKQQEMDRKAGRMSR